MGVPTRRPAVTACVLSSPPWTGRDSKGEGCGERKTIGGQEAWQLLVVRAGLLVSFPTIVVVVCSPCASLE